MPADPMSPEQLMEGYAPIRQATVDALRAVVRQTLPEAIEAVRPGWRLIGYDIPFGRRTRFVAFIWPEPEHVHIGFEHGVFMRDPGGILGGTFLKKVRFVTLTKPGEIPDEVIAELLREEVRVAGLSRQQRFAASLDADVELVPEP